MYKALGMLHTGERVYDRSPSHIHAGVRPLIREIVADINSRRRSTIVYSVKYDRPIGVSSVVATRPGDRIVFAKRQGRRGTSRFVKNRRSESTNVVTIILRQTPSGDYQVMTAHFGYPAPREPWDESHPPRQSVDFWKRHAFVWGVEPTVRGSESFRPPGR